MITIKIKTDNAAFEDDLFGREVGRILRALAVRFDSGEFDGATEGSVFDVNGNRVGQVIARK